MAFDLNFLLVVVELILLVPTLLLLVLGRREERGRRHLLEHISHTARMVSRQEYFNSVHSSMQRARTSISGIITGSAPKSKEGEELVQSIVDEISRASERGVIIRYLVPESQDRLRVASSYKQAGAEIKFLLGLVVNDLRFEVVDNKTVVIGLPGTAGQNQPTREGYLIPSEGLSEILSNQFENKWKNARSYDDYIGEVLNEIKSHNPNVSRELLLTQLQIPEGELQRFLSNESTMAQKAS